MQIAQSSSASMMIWRMSKRLDAGRDDHGVVAYRAKARLAERSTVLCIRINQVDDVGGAGCPFHAHGVDLATSPRSRSPDVMRAAREWPTVPSRTFARSREALGVRPG